MSQNVEANFFPALVKNRYKKGKRSLLLFFISYQKNHLAFFFPHLRLSQTYHARPNLLPFVEHPCQEGCVYLHCCHCCLFVCPAMQE
ncbi:hypothetical protein DM01DRAFT_1004811 [Hesseltinella vesiculosa]|uniref:Uncharacterized protein n=1 Tax=Hesseltinella vesiculosa TaxID=101127 RepID=A0A1X2GXD2_9FUNG|nr:hypothetical protein DM01DRAFT_1004811 [Hesseltinella vesiculosa]